jgi:hypothetical protein
MTDELDQYLPPSHTSWTGRTGRPAPAEDDAAPPGDGRYRAFGSAPGDDIESCNVSWWLTAEIPQGQEIIYRYLIRIGYVGDEQLHLMLTDCILHIEGRNLGELRRKLARRKVTLIQAFNPGIWPGPQDHEPIVEKISILYPGEKGQS